MIVQLSSERTMKINETFLSIQGEGPQSGQLTYFIRFSGCNLRCNYCDTKYAYYDGDEYTADSIISKVASSGAKNVCITGGEPLLQKELDFLAKRLIDQGYNIDLETNGSLKLPQWTSDKQVTVALDIKCLSSGMSQKMIFQNLRILRPKDFVKFVIASNQDYEYAKKISRGISKAKIYFHPVFSEIEPRDLAEKIIRDKLINVTFGLQIHKYIWPLSKRGV